VAAAQGHLDHYSPSDKAKLLQGKKNIGFNALQHTPV
jgi:hypothetical protein